MDIGITFLVGCMLFAPLASAVGKSVKDKYSSAQFFKDYALSACIADGYKFDEITSDASAAARGYLEFGGYPLGFSL